MCTAMKKRGVPGCMSRGIDEKTANHIYDEMIDFARYAFNKSHAAAYAVVAYQTAYLKDCYPVEYVGATLTSVIENSGKASRLCSRFAARWEFQSFRLI